MNAPQNLAALVDLAMVNRGVKSGRRLADLAQQHGHRLTNTTVNAIRSGTYKFQPTAETVRAIGWLAGVSDEVAFTAAGLQVPGPPFADELPPGVDNLSPRKRKAVIELLRVLIDDEEVMGNAEHPAPTSTTQTAQAHIAPADREGVASDEAKVHTLNPRDQGDPAPPADIAARDVGKPSRGQQAREHQDAEAERPDLPRAEE